MNILVFNAGSSSLKFALFEDATRERANGVVDWSGGQARLIVRPNGLPENQRQLTGVDASSAAQAIREALQNAELGAIPVDAIGQRVVHGGVTFQNSVRINAAVKTEIERLTELAPLHNPPALQSIAAAENAYPGVPQCAVFDTAYYQNLPPRHFIYPVPYSWYRDWGIRRFGFHGISHADCAQRVATMLRREDIRLVSCHLGQGCSATASVGRTAVATTMGFTPLEGLMMGSRSGSLDPGLLLYVERQKDQSAERLEKILNHASGIAGVSEISSDFREVFAAAKTGHAQARLATEMFCDRVRSAIGALAVTMGGLDVLVFTGGVGEHSADVRAEVCRGLECLGAHLAAPANQDPSGIVSSPDSKAKIIVLRAQEEKSIAAEVIALYKAI